MNITNSYQLNYGNLGNSDIAVNIAKFLEKDALDISQLVCKAWHNIFVSQGVQCIRLGLLHSDRDILNAIKNDELNPMRKRKRDILGICLNLVKHNEFAKADRCSAQLRDKEYLSYELTLNNQYKKLNHEGVFSYCEKEQRDFFDEEKLKEIGRFKRVAKRLDFDMDVES